MSDKAICNLPELIGGPFKQVMYLGCSVKDFKISVGWGGETSSCSVTLVKDPLDWPDFNQNTFSNPSDNYQKDLTEVFKNNIDPKKGNPELFRDIKNSPVVKKQDDYLGKRCYNVYYPYSNTSYLNLTKKDPGFLADGAYFTEWGEGKSYDIIGIPTIFKWEDIFFGGIIKNWTKENDKSYKVEINSFAENLKGIKLILKEYYGSLSTYIADAGYYPFNWAFFPSTDYKTPWPDRDAVAIGPKPGVSALNVFGYLESQGFGNSGYSRLKGIPADKVYDAVVENFSVDSTDSDAVYRSKNPFVNNNGASTRQLFDKQDNKRVDASSVEYEGINLNNFGLLDANVFKIDFSEVPKPPEGVYISADTMDLISFIDFCCNGAGMDYLISFDGAVRIKTIDRKIFDYRDDLKYYINSLDSSDKVISSSVGEEYNHGQINKIVIGGNQKRLYQARSGGVGTPFFKVYDPNLNQYFGGTGDGNEVFRHPNFLNWAGYRGSVGDLKVEDFISANGYSWSPHNFNDTVAALNYRLATVKGSYISEDLGVSDSWLGANNISPFFGIGKNGSWRNVYYDYKTFQLILKFNWTDLEPFLPGLYDGSYATDTIQQYIRTNIKGQDGFIDIDPLKYGTGDFIVTETELRAAGAGFEQWWDYSQTRAYFGAPSDITRIVYNYLTKNVSDVFADCVVFEDIVYDKSRLDYMQYYLVASATYAGRPLSLKPITHEQYIVYVSGIKETLRAIHAFLQDLVNTHYGKTYAVRLPNILSGYDPDGSKDNYVITDSAWETEGNHIDDTIRIGSVASSKLRQEDGRIGCLLGFDASAQYVSYGGPNTDMPTATIGPGKYAMQYEIALRMGFIGGTSYWPLVHNFANSDSVMVPHGTYGKKIYGGPSSALGTDPKRWRLYTKATPVTLNGTDKVNPNIIYDGLLPKIILTTPGQINSIADTSIGAVYGELYAIHNRGLNRPSTADTIFDRNFNLMPYSTTIGTYPLIFLKFVLWQHSRKGIMEDLGQQDQPSFIHKAPVPTFAAVPIESQYYRYGPWVSDVFPLREEVFPEFTQEDDHSELTKNLAGSMDIVIDDSLNPWEYGSEWQMSKTAAAVASLGNQYQTNIEVGSVTFAGLVIRGLNAGDKLSASKASSIISSISVTLDSQNGLTSTYSFRTASRKLGLFNKELSDTYKSFGQTNFRNNLKMTRENSNFLNAAGLISTTPNSTLLSRFSASWNAAFGGAIRTAGSVGAGLISTVAPANMVMIANNFVAPDRSSFKGSYKTPDNIVNVRTNGGVSKSYFSIVPDTMAGKFCGPNYSKLSIMSLDGLFSPISLYPTENNTTFSLAKYRRSRCPYCRGGKQYLHHYVDLQGLSNKEAKELKRQDTDNAGFKKTTTYAPKKCPYCIDDEAKKQEITQSYTNNTVDPPYILVSGSDYLEDRVEEYRDNPLSINKYSLNPIVLNSGDFGLSLAKQKGDKSAHNIDVCSFGHLPPAGGLSMRGSLSSNPDYNTEGVDQYLKEKNGDGKDIDNNVRFIGLRGPLVVHGWGYDVNGYPVPNASGQFKTNTNGEIVYHKGKPLYKNQVVNPDDTVTEPYAEHTFVKGWADKPGMWPVGPVDLRWDPQSSTWVAPQGYKRVWVTIENDLVDENPVRGAIESMGEPTDTLPSGYRRVVYVGNPLGTTRAPRYSALYCEYNPENNQYMPLNTSAVFATGVTLSSNSAKIYADYAYVEEDADVQTYTATFENPLNINITNDKKAIFVFGGENGWILSSIEE